jgi:hypothetical protein
MSWPNAKPHWVPLFESMQKLKAGWPARGWSWDSRINCVTSSFASEYEPRARAAVQQALPYQWVAATLNQAPPLLRDVADRSGGLRSGQMLFGAGPYGNVYAFGLWWPWADQETVSVRVGVVEVDPAREPYPTFREIFGVTL